MLAAILLLSLPFISFIEFYYIPIKGLTQCFFEYMSAETLFNGEIFSVEIGKINVQILNPREVIIFHKVILVYCRRMKTMG